MIVEYEPIYSEQIKDLLVELQEYLITIDEDKHCILTNEYKEQYFEKTIDEINKYNGKILLAKEDDKIIGLIVGLINNDEYTSYDFSVPKRGRITELIVSKNSRNSGIGTALLKKMEHHLKSIGCKEIILGVLAYNEIAIRLYEKNGYHFRMIDMTKTNI